ncbi:recombinase family protein [Vibrio vulnificus]|nr:recombinase family protein [Vibrio vulnificus]
MNSIKYVVYYRVSTQKQGKSGLGLEAQKRDVDIFLNNYSERPYEVVAEYTDIESGTKDDREQYQKAISMAKKTGASILVAKLDRLGRKVSEISRVMEEVIVKVACMPNADKFQLHIYAALAEQERDFISTRTKQALREAKARGVKLGRPTTDNELQTMQKNGNKAVTAKADLFALELAPALLPMRQKENSYADIAKWLNCRDIRTQRNKEWTPMGVCNLIRRVERLTL